MRPVPVHVRGLAWLHEQPNEGLWTTESSKRGGGAGGLYRAGRNMVSDRIATESESGSPNVQPVDPPTVAETPRLAIADLNRSTATTKAGHCAHLQEEVSRTGNA